MAKSNSKNFKLRLDRCLRCNSKRFHHYRAPHGKVEFRCANDYCKATSIYGREGGEKLQYSLGEIPVPTDLYATCEDGTWSAP